MPYKIDWTSPRAVNVQFFGVITDSDLSAATDDFYHDERVDFVREVTWDHTNIVDFIVTPERLNEIAASDSVASGYMYPLKSAFVIHHPAVIELAKGYIATLEELGSPWQNRIFVSLEEARGWLPT
jgi:hypothetical protein